MAVGRLMMLFKVVLFKYVEKSSCIPVQVTLSVFLSFRIIVLQNIYQYLTWL